MPGPPSGTEFFCGSCESRSRYFHRWRTHLSWSLTSLQNEVRCFMASLCGQAVVPVLGMILVLTEVCSVLALVCFGV